MTICRKCNKEYSLNNIVNDTCFDCLDSYKVSENAKKQKIEDLGIEKYTYNTIVELLDGIKANESLTQFKLLGDEYNNQVAQIDSNYDNMLARLKGEYQINRSNLEMQYDQIIANHQNTLQQIKANQEAKERQEELQNTLQYGNKHGSQSLGADVNRVFNPFSGGGDGGEYDVKDQIKKAKKDKVSALDDLADNYNTQVKNIKKTRRNEVKIVWNDLLSKGKSLFHTNKSEIVNGLEGFFSDLHQCKDPEQKVSDFLDFVTLKISVAFKESVFSENDISAILKNINISEDLKYIENKSIELYNKNKAHYTGLVESINKLGKTQDIILNLNDLINEELDLLKKYFEIDFNDINNSTKFINQNLKAFKQLAKNKNETLSRFEKIVNDYHLIQEDKDLINKIFFDYSEIFKTFEAVQNYAILPKYTNITGNSEFNDSFKTMIKEKFSIIDTNSLNGFYDNNYYTDNIRKEFKDLVDKTNNINQNISLIENFIENFNKNYDLLAGKVKTQSRKRMFKYTSLSLLVIVIGVFFMPEKYKINFYPDKYQIDALKGWADNIKYINNPSEAVQLAAVKEKGYDTCYALEHIKNPSEAVQLAAVKEYGDAIKFIKNPSEAVQLAAVKEDSRAFQYINNPSKAVQLADYKQHRYAKNHLGQKLYRNPSKFYKNPSESVQSAYMSAKYKF